MRRNPDRTSYRPSGISLLETVLSLLILSGAFVAALNTITAARASQAIVAERRIGRVLAEDLMAEILSHPYKEDALLGLELGENTGDRSNFDDIDDYRGWSSSPPEDVNGVPIPGAEGYTRTAFVQWIEKDNPTTYAFNDEGVKLILITVKRGDKVIVQLFGYRTDVYDNTEEGG